MSPFELPLSRVRRPTRRVMVGRVGIGADEPIRVQSMTTTDTGDVEATALQVQALAEAGCEIVRITAPNVQDARALEGIRERLGRLGVDVPLVADIHFNPHAALIAADFVEKVRINPGNYADVKKFAVREYSDDEYRAEIDRIREKFHPLVEKCRRLGRAMRIGTNHGSLSDRIMNRHGDTPLGMVESALEFVRLCEELDYRDLVLSMKSSNPFVAVKAYRLLAERMAAEGMDYPFHLGVTEAGFGEDGRVKSAIGIGSLLADGIGDTIRVSLTEDPVHEVPVAFALAAPHGRAAAAQAAPAMATARLTHAGRRTTEAVVVGSRRVGGEAGVSAWVDLGHPSEARDMAARVRELVAPPGSDAALADVAHVTLHDAEDLAVLDAVKPALWHPEGRLPLAVTASEDVLEATGAFARIAALAACVMVAPRRRTLDAVGESVARWARTVLHAGLGFGVAIDEEAALACRELPQDEALARCAAKAGVMALAATGTAPLLAILPPPERSPVFAVRMACALLEQRDAAQAPFLLVDRSAHSDAGDPLLEGATRLGGLLVDGLGDAVRVDGGDPREGLSRALGVLQATRLRMTRPDYISCPSCGRTLFDLETVTARIQSVTSHLRGVKIAIMGCIVNGPGEMADADFGYVGSSPGKVNLYVGKDCVVKNVPADEAPDRLVALIKEHGRWVEPAAKMGSDPIFR